MANRDTKTQRLSRKLYVEIGRRGDPKRDWWVNRDVVEREWGMNPDALFDAAELLYEDGRVSRHTSDLTLLRLFSKGPSTV